MDNLLLCSNFAAKFVADEGLGSLTGWMTTSMVSEEVEKQDAEARLVSTDVVVVARTMPFPLRDHRTHLGEPKLEALQGETGNTDFRLLSRFV